jgi:hypothetical protein
MALPAFATEHAAGLRDPDAYTITPLLRRIQRCSHGTNAFSLKPVDFGEFTEAVTHRGLFWLLLDQVPPSGAAR